MCGGITCLLAGDFILQPRNVLLCLGDTGLCSGHFGGKLRNLQHCNGLTLADSIADVDVDVTYVAGNFTVDIDLLEGLEDAGDGELIGYVTRVSGGHRDCWQRSSGSGDIAFTPGTQKKQ